MTKKQQSGQKGIVLLFWASVAFTAIVPILIGTLGGSASTAWAALVSGAFLTFIAKLADVAELSLGPVKARMREVIDEAAATTEQLREVATTIATAVMTDMMAGGFSGSMHLAERFELHDQLLAQLDKLGVSEDQKRRTTAQWRKGVAVIYHRIIGKLVNEEAKRVTPGTWTGTSSEYNNLLDFPHWDAPRPNEITKFCASKNLLTPEITSWIEDYRHFLDTDEIRRRDQFVQG